MRHSLIAGLFLALSCGLTACANSDYFESTALQDNANAMVYLYRPAATGPGKKPLVTSYPEITVNGKSMGMLRYKQYMTLELPPGQHKIVATGLTKDSRWEPEDRSYTLKTEAGKKYFMRFRVEFNTDSMSMGTFRGQYLIHLHPVDESEALYEIRHTSKAGDG